MTNVIRRIAFFPVAGVARRAIRVFRAAAAEALSRVVIVGSEALLWVWGGVLLALAHHGLSQLVG